MCPNLVLIFSWYLFLPWMYHLCLISAVILENTKSPNLFSVAFRLFSRLLIQVLFYTYINLSETRLSLWTTISLVWHKVLYILTNSIFKSTALHSFLALATSPDWLRILPWEELTIYCSLLLLYSGLSALCLTQASPFSAVAHEDPMSLPLAFSKLFWPILGHSHLSSLA